MKKGFIIVSLVFVSLLSGCTEKTNNAATLPYSDANTNVVETLPVKPTNNSNVEFLEKETNLTKEDKQKLEKVMVEFVDVGQGDSSFIITPNNDVILIDTGDSKSASEIINELNKYEFEDIDLMILSHPHADHIKGAESIIDTYDVQEIVMCSYVESTKTFENLLDKISSKGIKTVAATSDMLFNIDNVSIDIIDSDIISADCNNSSIIFKIIYNENEILYTGDLEGKGEDLLLDKKYDLSSDVLKIGHHGSNTSTSIDFLTSVNPSLCVISVGLDNKYNHPGENTLKLLKEKNIQYYRTDEVGTILLELDGKNIISVLNDKIDVESKKGFLFSPNIAEVQLEDEEMILNKYK